MALRDPLTQLPSEALFMDRLAQALAMARRTHRHIGLLRLTIEGDALEGDAALLHAASRRIEGGLRTTDTVSRFGGHDFIIVLNDIDSLAAARAVADELVMAIARPLEIAGRSHRLQTDYTLCLFPEDGADEEQLFSKL